jgi:hypothetical protein
VFTKGRYSTLSWASWIPLYTSTTVICKIHFIIIKKNSYSGGWRPNWVHSARRPLIGLLYMPRVIVRMGNLVEWRLARETEVLGESLPQRHFVHLKPHLTRPGLEARTRASAGTAWAMARLTLLLFSHLFGWPPGGLSFWIFGLNFATADSPAAQICWRSCRLSTAFYLSITSAA